MVPSRGNGFLLHGGSGIKRGQEAVTLSTMRSTRFWRHAAVSLIAAGPAGGFIFGLFHPGDPDPNPVGRFFNACIMAVVTPLHAGFPPRPDAAPDHPFNAWPHIAISFLLILGFFVYRDWKLSKKGDEPTS